VAAPRDVQIEDERGGGRGRAGLLGERALGLRCDKSKTHDKLFFYTSYVH
jgi:hypothetical protein